MKFDACNFSDRALKSWNSHVKSLTLPTTNAMGCENLKEMMLEEYFPWGEVQKLDHDLWNLTMVSLDIVTYTDRFSDLAALCPGMVTLESKKVERYILGLPSPIQGNILALKPLTFDIAKRLAQTLVDCGIRQGIMDPVQESTKGGDDKQRSESRKKTQSTQEPSERQQKGATYVATTPTTLAPDSRYAGTLPKCDKCKFHHTGRCQKLYCKNCLRRGQTMRFCRAPERPICQVPFEEVSQSCYECGKAGHYMRDCQLARNPSV